MFTSSIGYSLIKQNIGHFLQEEGFLPHKTATYYRITTGDILQYINFQKGIQSLHEQMTLNVVIQGLFSPSCSFKYLQPGGRIGQFLGSPVDLWWHCETEKITQDSIIDLTSLLSTNLLPCLDQLSTAKLLIDTFDAEKFRFLWNRPVTFIDRGFLYLQAKCYAEGLAVFRAHQPSKVGKFKTIQRFVEQNQYAAIDAFLQENIQHQKEKWSI